MTTTSTDPTALADTSVALPALAESHELHTTAFEAVKQSRAGIAGHALFEVYAVLTRHPALKVLPDDAVALLDSTFKHRAILSKAATSKTLHQLGTEGIIGGATYDALVAATAVEAKLPLLSLDRRARRTYEAVGAQVHYLGD